MKFDKLVYRNIKFMPDVRPDYKVVARENIPKHSDAIVISDWITRDEALALCKLLNSTKGELP